MCEPASMCMSKCGLGLWSGFLRIVFLFYFDFFCQGLLFGCCPYVKRKEKERKRKGCCLVAVLTLNVKKKKGNVRVAVWVLSLR